MNWLRSRKAWEWAIKRSSFTVLFDACVLYPAPLRDLLMELAAAQLFRAKWTDRIHEEWISNLLADRLDLNRQQLDRTKGLMNAAVMDATVAGYEDLIPALKLPDPDDRHVLAAAIVANCDAIITANVKDFPAEVLGRYRMEALHPDAFVHHQFGLNNVEALTAAQRCRSRLRNPPVSAVDYLAILRAQGLPRTVDVLSQYVSIL